MNTVLKMWALAKRQGRLNRSLCAEYEHVIRRARADRNLETPQLDAWLAAIPKTRRPKAYLRQGIVYMGWFNGVKGPYAYADFRSRYAVKRMRLDNRYIELKTINYNGVSATLYQENAILNLQNEYRAMLIDLDKIPNDRKRYLGIEIEFLSSDSRASIKSAFRRAGLASYVQLGSDGSVQDDSSIDYHDCSEGGCRDNCNCFTCDHYACELLECDCEPEFDENGDLVSDDYCQGHACQGDHDTWDCTCECIYEGREGYELRVLVPQFELEDVIKRVSNVLRSVDADVNNTCGLHVHLDMRGRNVAKAYSNLFNTQGLLYSMQPKSRRENNYCKPNREPKLVDEIATGVRYKCINAQSLKDHNTLEVRVHTGTTNANKIIGWCSLLIDLINAKQITRRITTYGDLIKNVKLRHVSKMYVQERLLTHNKRECKVDDIRFQLAG